MSHNNDTDKYEIKKVNGKGMGVFATQKINAGEMIISEQPLFKLTKIYTKVTEKIEDIKSELSQLTAEERELFLGLSDCQNPESPSVLTIYQTNALPLGKIFVVMISLTLSGLKLYRDVNIENNDLDSSVVL